MIYKLASDPLFLHHNTNITVPKTISIATKGEPSRADRKPLLPIAVVPGIEDVTVVELTVSRN